MSLTINPPLPEDLREKLDETAREQHREPAEVLEDALRRYLGVQALERLARNGEKYAQARGIKEEDVPQLVKDVRRENRDRGR
jgi:predicted transcriptional regulator